MNATDTQTAADQWLIDALNVAGAEMEIEEAKALTDAQTTAADALKAATAALKAAADAMTAAAAAAERVSEMTRAHSDDQAHWALEDTAATLNALNA